MSEACRALGIPVVGGNVSFYNESRGADIDPTPGGRRGRAHRRARPPCRPAPRLARRRRDRRARRHRARARRVGMGRPRTVCAAGRRRPPISTPPPRCTTSCATWSPARGRRRRARLLRRRPRGHARRDGDRRRVRVPASTLRPSSVPALAWFSESASRVVLAVEPAGARRRSSSGPGAAGVPARRLGTAGGDRLVAEGAFSVALADATHAWRDAIPAAPRPADAVTGSIASGSRPRGIGGLHLGVRWDTEPCEPDRQIGHACGVFGVYAPGQAVAHLTYLGLYALQHRGQESAGIAVSDGETITVSKDMGLVTQVFDERRLAPLDGHLAIGHVRYSTTGSSSWRNAQPVYRSVGDAGFALGPQRQPHQHRRARRAPRACCPGMAPRRHRPRLHHRLRARRRAHRPRVRGRAPLRRPRPRARARDACCRSCAGGFSFVMMDEAHLIGVRDPHGFWPLVLGRVERRLGARERDRRARHRRRALRARGRAGRDDRDRRVGRARRTASPSPTPSSASSSSSTSPAPTPCSTASSVHAARQRMGEELARQAPVDADMVMPVPESGIPAAQGYARASGIPYGDGLVKNRYVGRTFIQPSQKQRGAGRAAEAQPAPREHPRQAARRGRRLHRARHHHPSGRRRCCARRAPRRCTSACRRRRTSGRALRHGHRAAGRELLAADMSVGEIRDFLGVDSLAYLELDRLTTRHRRVVRLVLHRLPLGQLPGAGARSPTPSSCWRTTPPPADPCISMTWDRPGDRS